MIQGKHSYRLKNLIASMLLGLFLFSNFGVNLLGLHQHDSAFERGINISESHDCFICDFQNLSYFSNADDDFKFGNSAEEFSFSSPIYKPNHYHLGYLHSISSRGPPSHFTI